MASYSVSASFLKAFLVCLCLSRLNAEETVSTTSPPECTRHIRWPNGTESDAGIDDFLEMSCDDSLNNLRYIFSEDAVGTRHDLVASLGDLCSSFVDLISLMIQVRGQKLEKEICTLSGKLSSDFCQRHTVSTERNTALERDLDLLGYHNISLEVRKLIDLGANCTEKCDNGANSNVLCNAYYLLASLLITPPAQPPSPTPLLTFTQPSSHDQPSNKSRVLSHIISALKERILSLSKAEILPLTYPPPSVVSVILKERFNLSSALHKEIANLSEFKTVMRMFLIVKMDPGRLRDLTNENFRFSKGNGGKSFLQMVTFTDADKKIVQDFDDLVAIIDYFIAYKSFIFAANDQTSNVRRTGELKGENSNGLGGNEINSSIQPKSNDEESDGEVREKLTAPKEKSTGSDDRDTVLTNSDIVNNPFGEDDEFEGYSSRQSPGDENRQQNQNDDNKQQNQNGPQNQNDENEPRNQNDENGQQNQNDENGLQSQNGQQNQNDENGQQNQNDENGQQNHNDENGQQHQNDENGQQNQNGQQNHNDENGQQHQNDENGQQNQNENVHLVNPDNGHNVSPNEDKGMVSGSYGAFHFLFIILFFGSVVVIAYLCVHNRKKLREGVGGYMSGPNKRKRRTREYKPLITSEA